MIRTGQVYLRRATMAMWGAVLLAAGPALAQPDFGPEQIIQAGGADIEVPGYSVPSFADWNSDGLNDLIVGQGSGAEPVRVRVYLNTGTPGQPQFGSYFYAQSSGGDLTVPGSGCLGCFPRVVYWDADDKKDLLVGLSDGTVKLYANVGTDEAPTFDGGTLLQVGPSGDKDDIDVGYRATATVVDFNSDGRKDLVIGALDSRVRIFLNEGTDDSPDFLAETLAQEYTWDLLVPASRSSPAVADLDWDGKKDLLSGNTNGELIFYSNVGTDEAPTFAAHTLATSEGVPIDLAGTPRSRPAICDWTGDCRPDILVGAGDGLVRLYQALDVPGDATGEGVVDGADYTIWADHYLAAGVDPYSQGGWLVGNFNEDTDVDGADYTIWADHYAPALAPAPEPAALSLLILGAAGLLRRRR